jgi:hypothetical protein
MNKIKITVICFRVCVVSVGHSTHVKLYEKCQSDYIFPPKVAGKVLSLVSQPSFDTLLYMKLKSIFINFLWNCSLYRNGCMIYKLHFLLTFLGKCTEKFISYVSVAAESGDLQYADRFHTDITVTNSVTHVEVHRQSFVE